VKSRQQLIYGLGARFSEGRFLEAGSGLVFSPANNLDYLLSGFFEDDITVVEGKLLLTLGTKVLGTNYTAFEAEPSIRLLWTPSEKHTFWASFTHSIRTPSRAEHDFYLSSYLAPARRAPLFARFNANPDFETEQLNGYEAGYRILVHKNFFIDFAGFWNHYHDLFSQDLTAPPGTESTLPFPEAAPPPVHTIITTQFRNDLFGFTTGGEIAPEWRSTSFWRLRASYSFLNMNLSRPRERPWAERRRA
jgi:iron complex outermembrane recepter protein